MRRLVVVLALGAALALGAGVPAASAQYAPGGYGYGYGYGGACMPTCGYPGYGAAGGYGMPAYGGYGGYGVPYGGFGTPGYGGYGYNWAASYPILTGQYNATGAPTFGLFPYLAQAGNFANPAPYGYYQPYAFFLGCSATYTASNYYVCR